MNNFEIKKREPLLTEDVFNEKTINYFEDTINDIEYFELIDNSTKPLIHRKRISWTVFSEYFEKTILDYSAGCPISEVVQRMRDSLAFYTTHKDKFPNDVLQYWEPDAYQYLLWLYSLAVMTGESQQIVSITRWLAKNNMGDDDPLLSILLARLGIEGLPRQEELVFPNSYKHLFDAIKGDGVNPTKEERQQSLTLYLKGWYKGMKHCYWYNRHKGRFPTFFGYWAFEAGLVTLLYDLDDSSYRHMLYYPADFVDYARAQGYNKINFTKHHILFAGDECPCDGVWWANLSNDKVFLKKGERIPAPAQNKNEHTYFWINQ